MRRGIKNKVVLLSVLLLNLFIVTCNANTIGSLTAPSYHEGVYFPAADSDNEMIGFAFVNGFSLANYQTTCTFGALMPVSGDVYLNGGTLTLTSDMIFQNVARFVNIGIIDGNGHVLDLSESMTELVLSTTELADDAPLLFNQLALQGFPQDVNSVDWSPDDNYIVSGLDGSGGNPQVFVHQFDNGSLTLKAKRHFSAQYDVFSARWHPTLNYVAIGNYRGSTGDLEVLYFDSSETSPVNALQLQWQETFNGEASAVSWHPTGTWVACGTTDNNRELNIYHFDSTFVSSVDLTTDQDVSHDALDWDISGSYLAAGLTAHGSGDELAVFHFDGVVLTQTVGKDIGETVRALDWHATDSLIVVGLSGGTQRLRLYELNEGTWTLDEVTSAQIGETQTILSVHWTPNGKYIVLGLEAGTGTVFRIYSYNSTSKTFHLKYELNSTENVNGVRWAHDSCKLARGDDRNYLTVYGCPDDAMPLTFANLKLFMNTDVALRSPIAFSGDCLINTRGNKFIIKDEGVMHVSPSSTLRFEFGRFRFEKPGALALHAEDSRIEVQDAVFDLVSDSFIAEGSMYIDGDLRIAGPYSFEYGSELTSTIGASSKLKITDDTTFRVGQICNHGLQPLEFLDDTSWLYLDNTTLALTHSGLSLTKGNIDVYGKSVLSVDCLDCAQTLTIGDGTSSNDVRLSIRPGAELDIASGGLVVNSYGTQPIQFLGNRSQLSLNTTSSLYVENDLFFDGGSLYLPAGSLIDIASGAYLTTDKTRINDFYQEFYMTGTLLSQSSLVLDQNDEIILTHGNLSKTITVSRDGNIVQGDGVVSGDLLFTDANTTLTWALDAKVDEDSITLNNGKIVLERDLHFYQDLQGQSATGIVSLSGEVDLNGNRFNFGSDDLHSTGTILWKNGGLINLWAKTSVSGNWKFDGFVGINGNGNILDLKETGSLIVQNGGTLYLKDLTLKGLGENKGQLLLADDDAQVYMSNVDVVLAGDYTTTLGGIYVEGPGTWYLDDYDWTFNLNASLTVDGMTLWTDSLDKLVGGDVLFGDPPTKGFVSRAPSVKANHLGLLNSGTIKTRRGDDDDDYCELCEYIEYNSNWIHKYGDLVIDNSNWIVNHTECCDSWSQLIIDNSNWIANYSDCCQLVIDNSNWIANHTECCDSWSQLIIDNSNWIANYSDCCDLVIDNSNWIANYSDCCQLVIDNSNWIANHTECCDSWSQLIIDNSNWIANYSDCCDLVIDNSNWIASYVECCDSWSQLIIDNSNWIANYSDCCDLVIDNSNWIAKYGGDPGSPLWCELCEYIEYNSNWINKYGDLVIENSDWIASYVECCDSWSQLIIDNSNWISNYSDCCDLVIDNSNWIVNHTECCDSWSQLIIDNSNWIVNYSDCCQLVIDNSNWIVNHTECCDSWSQLIIDNSNWIANYSDCCDLVVENSYAIINLSKNVFVINLRLGDLEDCCELAEDNSEWIVNHTECCDNWSQLIVDNSNWIVNHTCGLTGCASCEDILIGNTITSNISLECSCHLHPGDEVVVDGEVTIEGNGAMVVFSNPDKPQFIVEEGSCLTLQNITLKQINSNTFSIAECAEIKIGENVLFELSEDVTFSAGTFEIIEADGGPNVWTVRGMGGVKKLRFISTCCRQRPSYDEGRHRVFRDVYGAVDLNYHTMQLQDIELLSVDDIIRSTAIIGEDMFMGSIGLSGGVVVNIDVSTNLGFVVEGIDNEMRLLANELTLNGCLLFEGSSDNMLHVNAAIPELLPNPPEVIFGDGFLSLHANSGRAGITFDDTEITVRNAGPCSFVAGDHSFIGGLGVEILTNPIKQATTDLELGPFIELTSDQPNAIVYDLSCPIKAIVEFRAPVEENLFDEEDRMADSEAEIFRVMTALQAKRKKEQEDVDRALKIKEGLPKIVRERRPKRNTPRRSVLDEFEEIDESSYVTRNVYVPRDMQIIYHNKARSSSAKGNILLRGASLTAFGVDPEESTNITMQHGSTIEQDHKPVTLKAGDIINVVGTKNKIVVHDTFIIEGELLFAPDAHLTIEFDEDAKNPQVIFENATVLELEAGAHLEFKGHGTVIFGDGMIVDYRGESTNDKTELMLNKAVGVQIPGNLTFKGVGSLKADDGSKVEVLEGGHICFGESATDKLELFFDRLSMLNIFGKVSLCNAEISVFFDRASTMVVHDKAELEVNLLDGILSPGNVTRFVMEDDARMKVGASGTLSFAENRDWAPIHWNLAGGRVSTIGQGGIVKLIQDPAPLIPFAGRMPDVATLEKNMLFVGVDTGMAKVIELFLQREGDKLRHNTVFFDGNGNRILRTNDGMTVLLSSKDIVEEDASGKALVNGFYV